MDGGGGRRGQQTDRSGNYSRERAQSVRSEDDSSRLPAARAAQKMAQINLGGCGCCVAFHPLVVVVLVVVVVVADAHRGSRGRSSSLAARCPLPAAPPAHSSFSSSPPA